MESWNEPTWDIKSERGRKTEKASRDRVAARISRRKQTTYIKLLTVRTWPRVLSQNKWYSEATAIQYVRTQKTFDSCLERNHGQGKNVNLMGTLNVCSFPPYITKILTANDNNYFLLSPSNLFYAHLEVTLSIGFSWNVDYIYLRISSEYKTNREWERERQRSKIRAF